MKREYSNGPKVGLAVDAISGCYWTRADALLFRSGTKSAVEEANQRARIPFTQIVEVVEMSDRKHQESDMKLISLYTFPDGRAKAI
jgi:hypothetical protein